MKYSVSVFILACILSTTLGFIDDKIGQVETEVMSYVRQSMGGVRMMRGSASHLSCYDDFIPLINSLATEAKDASQTCVNNADVEREDALKTLKDARSELAIQVKRIQDSLTECTSQPEGLGYFECLLNLVDEDKSILDNIASRSRGLVTQYSDIIKGIDTDEEGCLRNAVESAKRKSDQAFEDLKSCLVNGPQTTA